MAAVRASLVFSKNKCLCALFCLWSSLRTRSFVGGPWLLSWPLRLCRCRCSLALLLWLNVQSEEKSVALAMDSASGVVTGETGREHAAGGDRERTCVVTLPCGSGYQKPCQLAGLGFVARGTLVASRLIGEPLSLSFVATLVFFFGQPKDWSSSSTEWR